MIKSHFFYNIPINFKNTSLIICNRLDLFEYETHIESLFQKYLTNYKYNPAELNQFLNEKNPLKNQNFNFLSKD